MPDRPYSSFKTLIGGEWRVFPFRVRDARTRATGHVEAAIRPDDPDAHTMYLDLQPDDLAKLSRLAPAADAPPHLASQVVVERTESLAREWEAAADEPGRDPKSRSVLLCYVGAFRIAADIARGHVVDPELPVADPPPAEAADDRGPAESRVTLSRLGLSATAPFRVDDVEVRDGKVYISGALEVGPGSVVLTLGPPFLERIRTGSGPADHLGDLARRWREFRDSP